MLPALLALTVGCSGGGVPKVREGAAASGYPTMHAPRSLAAVMAEVARSFESAGRAAEGGHYDLVRFDASELEQLFEGEVPEAVPPKDVPLADLSRMNGAFLEVNVPEINRAAASKDPDRVAAALARAGDACRACHAASRKSSVAVPSFPGEHERTPESPEAE
jgi:hypothetical protein